MSNLGDAADVNPVIKFLPQYTVHSAHSYYRIDICRVTKGAHIENL